MGMYKIFTGEDGKSHITEMQANDSFWDSVETAPTLFLKEFPRGTFLDWHPAPRKQIVIILSGRLEHGFRDGSRHAFGPGDVRLLVDTTGEGHQTRVLGEESLLVAVVPLAGESR